MFLFNKIKKKLVIITISILLVSLFWKEVYAQANSQGLAISLPIQGENVRSGNIVCAGDAGFILCQNAYDAQVIGVVNDNPALVLDAPGTEGEKTRLVLQDGTAEVIVSGINGPISEGDFIATSVVPGVGQRADRNGYVLGSALEAFEPENTDDTDTILVAINIHPAAGLSGARSDLLQALRQGLSAPIFEPLSALRYILAALMILVAFSLGFIYFGRVAKTGIEAIGRNPMASKMIQISVVINIVITIIIVLIGLAIAYLILIL
jgi:F0F1-type ATP synthase membrane subunit c/vacuolar-type H+-ATPase subunit K